MKNLNKNIIMSDYEKLKKLGIKLYKKRRFDECISVLKSLSWLMYNYNIIYTDDDIENIIISLASEYHTVKKVNTNNTYVLFYDYWAIDTRGLTTIYLSALLKNGYNIIFLTYLRNNNEQMSIIKSLLSSSSDSHLFFLDEKKSNKKLIQEMLALYEKFNPNWAFFHSMPNDVLGCIYFAALSSTKFLINLTDHAFWIGKKSVDYIIEFRNYGYTVSIQKRLVPPSALIKLPYYPVITKNVSTDAVDFFKQHSKVIVSGGSLSKIYGDPSFLDIVKYILDTYHDAVFVFIGNGNSKSLISFIQDNNYTDRFFLFPERPDFCYFIEHCFFYLNTYPIIGGLMTQYAIYFGKIPLTLKKVDDSSNDIMELFIKDCSVTFSFNSIFDIKKEIDSLFNDKKYKENKENIIKNLIISEDNFNTQVGKIIKANSSDYNFAIDNIDYDSYPDKYISAQNNINNDYERLFLLSRNIYIYFKFIKYVFIAGVRYILSKLLK